MTANNFVIVINNGLDFTNKSERERERAKGIRHENKSAIDIRSDVTNRRTKRQD